MEQRSKQFNKSFHKWCDEVARASNMAGVPLRIFYDKIHVDWSMEAVKALAQSISQAKFGTPHTSELTNKQLSDVHLEVDKMFLEEGINVPFPSSEDTADAITSYNQYI